MGVFIWTYYNAIDVVEFPSKINERVAAVVAAGGNEAKARAELTNVFNPFSYASITFFTLLIVGAMNALIIGLLHHKVLRSAPQGISCVKSALIGCLLNPALIASLIS